MSSDSLSGKKRVASERTVNECAMDAKGDRIPGFLSQIITSSNGKNGGKKLGQSAEAAASVPFNPFVNDKTASEALWHPVERLIEVMKMKGNFWKTMGFSMRKRDYLFPEEALILMERGQMIVNRPDDASFLHPHHRRFKVYLISIVLLTSLLSFLSPLSSLIIVYFSLTDDLISTFLPLHSSQSSMTS